MMGGVEVPVGFHTILRTGDKAGDGIFGDLISHDGKAIGKISANPDFTSLLVVGKKLFSVSHFEDAPGAMYLSEFAQDADGNMTPVSTRPIDLSGVDGIWYPCAGSVTPWNTHLGSEEYPDDARAAQAAATVADIDEDTLPMARYFGLDPATMTVEAFKAARYMVPATIKVPTPPKTPSAPKT